MAGAYVPTVEVPATQQNDCVESAEILEVRPPFRPDAACPSVAEYSHVMLEPYQLSDHEHAHQAAPRTALHFRPPTTAR